MQGAAGVAKEARKGGLGLLVPLLSRYLSLLPPFAIVDRTFGG